MQTEQTEHILLTQTLSKFYQQFKWYVVTTGMPKVKVKKDPDAKLKQSFYYFLLAQFKKPPLDAPLTKDEDWKMSVAFMQPEVISNYHDEHKRYKRLMKKSGQLDD